MHLKAVSLPVLLTRIQLQHLFPDNRAIFVTEISDEFASEAQDYVGVFDLKRFVALLRFVP